MRLSQKNANDAKNANSHKSKDKLIFMSLIISNIFFA
jgi:hypothetical protein